MFIHNRAYPSKNLIRRYFRVNFFDMIALDVEFHPNCPNYSLEQNL